MVSKSISTVTLELSHHLTDKGLSLSDFSIGCRQKGSVTSLIVYLHAQSLQKQIPNRWDNLPVTAEYIGRMHPAHVR